eukprot:4407596-Prymnesium_polylepis.1
MVCSLSHSLRTSTFPPISSCTAPRAPIAARPPISREDHTAGLGEAVAHCHKRRCMPFDARKRWPRGHADAGLLRQGTRS